MTTLYLLPTRTGGAAENMAIDFLLLQRYPHAAMPRFRHYAWRGPAFTFGYAQKAGFVREQVAMLAGPGSFDLCRRPTGGGLVDHREDWTYALVIPRGHPLEELAATQSYRVVHEALAEALRAQGVPAKTTAVRPDGLEPLPQPAPRGERDPAARPEGEPSVALAKEGVCFQRAEIHDVIHAGSGAKIAGAAQKRNKHGLLFQGSIWQPAAGAIDWEEFEAGFTERLASALGATAEPKPWPDLDEDEVNGLTEKYSTPEWNEFR